MDSQFQSRMAVLRSSGKPLDVKARFTISVVIQDGVFVASVFRFPPSEAHGSTSDGIDTNLKVAAGSLEKAFTETLAFVEEKYKGDGLLVEPIGNDWPEEVNAHQ